MNTITPISSMAIMPPKSPKRKAPKATQPPKPVPDNMNMTLKALNSEKATTQGAYASNKSNVKYISDKK